MLSNLQNDQNYIISLFNNLNNLFFGIYNFNFFIRNSQVRSLFNQKQQSQKVKSQMFSDSLQQLQISPQKFPLEQVLISLCKKSTLQQSPQIDFLDFNQKVNQLNTLHQKTCQQIVQFVDTHCSEYIQINDSFSQLQQKIQKAQHIIKLVNAKVKQYQKIYYQDQARIQQILAKYQTSIVQKLLLNKCKQQTQFLTKFVLSFQSIIGKSMDNLLFKQRSLLIRFCYKFKYLQSLFNHHILHQTLPEYIKIYQMLLNLVDEVEFYISEQLSKLIKYKNYQNPEDPKIVALSQIKLCYKYLNKVGDYYKHIEQNIIGNQMKAAEKNLISNKINLIGGKNIEVVQQFFVCIFNLIRQFPSSYPQNRLLQLIFSQLKKNEIKFLYTYTLPIFPISYNYYIKFVESLNEPSQIQLKNCLLKNHNWDLKRWIDVRQKNILDRCAKDWQKQAQKNKCPELNKWIDIIFKQNCRIDGVKTQIVKLAIKVVKKYSLFMQKTQSFQSQHLNKYVQIYQQIQKLINQKALFFFQSSLQRDSQKITRLCHRLAESCKQILEHSISSLILKNTKLLSKSCCGSLQPYKNFIVKIIKSSKQLSQHGIINLFSTVFKPLISYLDNQSSMSDSSKQWIKKVVIKQVMQYFDQSYVTEVYNYIKKNISIEQQAQVMQVIAKQRGILFDDVTEKDKNKIQKIKDVSALK